MAKRDERRLSRRAAVAGARRAPGITPIAPRPFAPRFDTGTAGSLARGLRAMTQPAATNAVMAERKRRQDEQDAGAQAFMEGNNLEDYDASDEFIDGYMKLHGKRVGADYKSALAVAMADPENFNPDTDDPMAFAAEFRKEYFKGMSDPAVLRYAAPDVLQGEYSAINSARTKRLENVMAQRFDNAVVGVYDEVKSGNFNIANTEGLMSSLPTDQRNLAYLEVAKKLAAEGEVEALDALVTASPRQGVKSLEKGRYGDEVVLLRDKAEAVLFKEGAVAREEAQARVLENFNGKISRAEPITMDELIPHVRGEILSAEQAVSLINRSLAAIDDLEDNSWMRAAIMSGEVYKYEGGHTDKSDKDFTDVMDQMVAEAPEEQRFALAVDIYRRNGYAPSLLENTFKAVSPQNHPEQFEAAMGAYEYLYEVDPKLTSHIVKGDKRYLLESAHFLRGAGWSQEAIMTAVKEIDPAKAQSDYEDRFRGSLHQKIMKMDLDDGFIFDTEVSELENRGFLRAELVKVAEGFARTGLFNDEDQILEAAASVIRNNVVVANGMAIPVTEGMAPDLEPALDWMFKEVLPEQLPEGINPEDVTLGFNLQSGIDRQTVVLVDKATREPVMNQKLHLPSLVANYRATLESSDSIRRAKAEQLRSFHESTKRQQEQRRAAAEKGTLAAFNLPL